MLRQITVSPSGSGAGGGLGARGPLGGARRAAGGAAGPGNEMLQLPRAPCLRVAGREGQEFAWQGPSQGMEVRATWDGAAAQA